MSFIQIDPLRWMPDDIKRQILDGVVDFVVQQAEKMLGAEISGAISKLKSDAAFQDAFDEGVERATERFAREYVQQDEDLVAAIAGGRDFWQTKSVRWALLAMIQRPGRWSDEDRQVLTRHFDDVLPQRVNRERVDRAVVHFLRCLAEEVWHLPQLHPVYELQLQRVTADRATEMVRELRGMRADVREAMVALVQGMAQQRKALTVATRLTLPEPSKVYHNLPQPDYVRFVGRTEELARVRELLSLDNRAWVIVIDGIGGIGKSALALEMAHRYLHKFDKLPEEERFQAIIWTSAKAATLTADGIAPRQQITRTLDDIYTTISVALEREDITRARPEEQDDLVRRALTQQRTLLIIDNLETIDDERVNAFLRELPSPTKCIVTTRHRIDVAYPIRLTGMPHEDGLALIVQECEKKGVMLIDEQADLLYRRTGGVPLAIVWSVAQMGYGHSVGAVLRRLGTPTDNIARYCFEGTMERVRGKPAHKLLMALSLFATDANREALGYVVDLPELDRDDGLVELQRLSLMNKQGERFSFLPITRGLAKDLLSRDRRFAQDCRQRWIEYYTAFVEQRALSDPSDRELLEIEYENIVEVVEQVWASGQVQTREDLLNRFFIFLWRRGHWAEAVRQAKKLLSWADDNQQVHWQARFNHWLGRLYLFQNLLHEAETHLILASEQYGEGDWQWVSVQTYLAQVYLRRRMSQRAEEILESTLPKALKQEGGPGRGCARIFNTFAEIRLDGGEIEEAQDYASRALEICEGKIEHVTVLGRTYYLLAQTQLVLKNLESAEMWMGKYLDLAFKEGFVQEIAVAEFGLAQVGHLLAKPHEAHRLAGEALVLFERAGMYSELLACRRFLAEISK